MTVSLGQVLAGEIIITATGDLDTTDTAEVIIIMTIFYRTVPDKPSELNPPAVRKLILSSQRQISAASIKNSRTVGRHTKYTGWRHCGDQSQYSRSNI